MEEKMIVKIGKLTVTEFEGANNRRCLKFDSSGYENCRLDYDGVRQLIGKLIEWVSDVYRVDREVYVLPATVNEITPAQWRAMSERERELFNGHWWMKGWMGFRCLGCGYPTEHVVMTCEACPKEG